MINQGEAYTDAKPVTHIGFLNFTPFPDVLEFNATYKILNTKNHNLYSDKIILNVIDLTHIELATNEDKAYEIDYWARLFKATTWEELKMIADKNIYLENASQTMYELSSDELVQRQCRARRDYYKQINTHNRTIRELEETTHELEEANKELDAVHKEIDAAHKEIDAAHKEIDAAHKEIDAAHKEIEQLQKRIAELESQQQD